VIGPLFYFEFKHFSMAAERIKLRAKRLSDAKDDYAWQTDPELAKLDAADVLDMSYPQYVSEYSFELCYPGHGRYEFGVDTLDGKHIGNCVYYNVSSRESKAELGIMIGNRDYWDQGYGCETVRALLSYIFSKTNMEQVYLTTLEWNTRAQKCFKKCGFSECGRLVRDKYDFLLMTINRDEFIKLASSQQEPSLKKD
jgi:RimJ/RimL family protein N-acetyltransferase